MKLYIDRFLLINANIVLLFTLVCYDWQFNYLKALLESENKRNLRIYIAPQVNFRNLIKFSKFINYI